MPKEIWFYLRGFLPEGIALSNLGRLCWKGILFDPELHPEKGYVYRIKTLWYEVIIPVKSAMRVHIPFPPRINGEWAERVRAMNKEERGRDDV
jgi:hypothetical protein